MRQTELNAVGDGLAHAFKHYKNFWDQEPIDVEVFLDHQTKKLRTYRVQLKFLDPMDPIEFTVVVDGENL